MIDRRHVYVMVRTAEDRADILTTRKVLNAIKVENLLHDLFRDKRFLMTEEVKQSSWVHHHIKIGISKNPKSRKNSISKNIFGSGRTEWFELNDIELVILRFWLWWYAIYWKFYLILFTSITLLIAWAYIYTGIA